MPESVKRNQRYMPGLDGLRAVAVLAVIAFHLGFGWAPGGLLGVGIFFTLSGAQANASTVSSRGAVVHIGDSISEGLTSPEYPPLESQRIEAQHADVGVKKEHFEISGARSIEERFEGEPNGREAAEAWKLEG